MNMVRRMSNMGGSLNINRYRGFRPKQQNNECSSQTLTPYRKGGRATGEGVR